MLRTISPFTARETYLTHFLEHAGEVNAFHAPETNGDFDVWDNGPFSMPFSQHVAHLKEQCRSRMPAAQALVVLKAVQAFERSACQGRLDGYFSLPALAESFRHLNEYSESLRGLQRSPLTDEQLKEATRRYYKSSAAHISQHLLPSFNVIAFAQRRILRYAIEHHVLPAPAYAEKVRGFLNKKKTLSSTQEAYYLARMTHGVICSIDQQKEKEPLQAAREIAQIGPHVMASMNFGLRPDWSQTLIWAATKILNPDAAKVIYLHQVLIKDRILPWFRT